MRRPNFLGHPDTYTPVLTAGNGVSSRLFRYLRGQGQRKDDLDNECADGE